jgi:8-oxo-dGTP diphosphatase
MNRRLLAKAVLTDHLGNVLLLRRSSTDTRRPNEWDFPGGKVEDGEEYKAACSRETKEEAGLDVAPDQLALAYAESAVAGEQDDQLAITWLFFTATTEQTEVVLSFEHSEFCWVPLAQALELIEYDRQKRALAFISHNKLI